MGTTSQKKKRPQPPRKRRRRRSTEEVLNCIVDAAVEEFSENGYSNTTTAAIARRAGVVEALIFNHFESKANLFQKAVYKSLDDQFSDFMATHHVDGLDMSGFLTESREFVSELVHFVRAHSGLFKSMVVNETFPNEKDGGGSHGLQGLQEYFNKMAAVEGARLKKRPNVSPHLIARISFAAILATVMYENWLFPVGIASEREIHEALCDFIMDGLNVNAPMQFPPVPLEKQQPN